MNILAYNRIIKKVNEETFRRLREDFDLTEQAEPVPEEQGTVYIYYKGSWYGLRLPESEKKKTASQLDVARLQNHNLSPLFGIENPRTDENIDHVGGIRGTK